MKGNPFEGEIPYTGKAHGKGNPTWREIPREGDSLASPQLRYAAWK